MSNNTHQFVISVMSEDRVGIVHDISLALSQLDGDITDVSQTVLRGHFTMILLVTVPAHITVEAIQNKLSQVRANSATALSINVESIDDVTIINDTPPAEQSYVLTATGPDQIGFVATVSRFCVENQINILDLSTAVSDNIYTMILLIDLSHSPPIDTIRQKLKTFCHESGLQVVLQHNDIFKAIHEVTL